MKSQNFRSSGCESAPFEPERNQSRLTSAATRCCVKFSIAGFLAMLLACCFYLKFGPISIGEPTTLWAKIIFYPGILVGRLLFLNANLTVNQSTCGGVLAMGLLGATIGYICGTISKSKIVSDKQIHK
jgi:hypothetical protein